MAYFIKYKALYQLHLGASSSAFSPEFVLLRIRRAASMTVTGISFVSCAILFRISNIKLISFVFSVESSSFCSNALRIDLGELALNFACLSFRSVRLLFSNSSHSFKRWCFNKNILYVSSLRMLLCLNIKRKIADRTDNDRPVAANTSAILWISLRLISIRVKMKYENAATAMNIPITT